MHALYLADLAALLALHGPTLLYRREWIPEEAVQSYWVATRSRADRWHEVFGAYRRAEQAARWGELRRWWDAETPILEEVLLSEMLTRVYAALGAGLDSKRERPEVGPVLHAVHVTHLEARNRALQLMVYGRGGRVELAVRLNRLRSGVERWTDALLGQLAVGFRGALEYAFDPRRARGFAEDALLHAPGAARSTIGWLITATLRDSLRRRVSDRSGTGPLNERVAETVMMCLRPDLFDSVGLLRSLWLHRLQAGAEQTDQVVRHLAAADLAGSTLLSGFEMIWDRQFTRRAP